MERKKLLVRHFVGTCAFFLLIVATRLDWEELLEGVDLAALLAGLSWLIAAGLVVRKPKLAMWLFIGAAIICLIGDGARFSGLFLWAVASFALAAMSWFKATISQAAA